MLPLCFSSRCNEHLMHCISVSFCNIGSFLKVISSRIINVWSFIEEDGLLFPIEEPDEVQKIYMHSREEMFQEYSVQLLVLF